jgi:GTP pyrophosphokinase
MGWPFEEYFFKIRKNKRLVQYFQIKIQERNSMIDEEKNKLAQMVLAPYIQKAYALIGVSRRTGGNQFRHCMATMSILIDYHYIDAVLLKASLLHDLFEDFTEATDDDILSVRDGDEEAVLALVKELTRMPGEPKALFYERLSIKGSLQAKIIKCADVISNLTDLHIDVSPPGKIRQNLVLYEKFILPMARDVNPDMAHEMEDLIRTRHQFLKMFEKKGWLKRILRRGKSD